MIEQKTLLLVDDEPNNIGVLFHVLRDEGYYVHIANDGESALNIATQIHPDLVVLDITMPGIDGYETCQRLHQMEEYTHVPVIFITARTDTDSKLKGFAAGGVDYITKPFEHTEILARIHTHLTLYSLQQELRNKNAELDAFSHTVAHDLKSPMHLIQGLAENLHYQYANQLDEEALDMLKTLQRTSLKVSDIVESLLLLAGTSRHQALYLEPFGMEFILPRIQERIRPMIEEYQAQLSYPTQWPYACGFPPWVEEVWVNYLTNAIKYGGQPPKVELGFTETNEQVCFWVRDNGPGLTKEQQNQLFVPFTRLHRDRAEGHGLGLSIVERIMQKLRGNAGVESAYGQGSQFYFTLPKRISS